MSRVWLGLLLMVITALSYSSSFPGAFHYDDYPLVLENPSVTQAGFDYLSFLHQYGGRPLTLWTFHVNYHLAGDNALAFHLVNVMLHGLVVWLLFTLVARWSARTDIGFFTAVLFAVHPSQIQAVNYIWARSILLMSVFVLLALLTKRPWLRLIFFQLAIWGRAEALVAAIPLIWKNPGRWKGIVMLASINLTCFLTGFLLEDPAAIAWNHSNPTEFWLTSGEAFCKYLFLAAIPPESIIYHSALGLSWQAVPTLGFLPAFGAFLWLTRRKWPNLAIGMGWFTLFLGPGLLIPNAAQYTESRVYLAVAGVCFLVAWSFSKAPPQEVGRSVETGATGLEADPRIDSRSRLAQFLSSTRFLLFLLMVAAFAWTTYGRNSIWLDDAALWEQAVRKYPMDFIPHYNLAAARVRQGRMNEAEKEFRLSQNLNQADDMAYAGLGYCAELREAWFEALEYYESALLINPANHYAIESSKRVRAIMRPERLSP